MERKRHNLIHEWQPLPPNHPPLAKFEGTPLRINIPHDHNGPWALRVPFFINGRSIWSIRVMLTHTIFPLITLPRDQRQLRFGERHTRIKARRKKEKEKKIEIKQKRSFFLHHPHQRLAWLMKSYILCERHHIKHINIRMEDSET